MEVCTHNKIEWNVLEGIGYMSFKDPPENKMDEVFFREFHHILFNELQRNHLDAVIISGKKRHFSSGADLNNLLEVIQHKSIEPLISNHKLFHLLENLQIPVIAAIKGVCIGSALELALHCHFRLCSEDAILGLPESTFGLMPGVGGIPKLMQLSGKSKTIELVLKGNTFNATDALKWNIVDAIYPKKMLMNKAIDLARNSMKNYRRYNKKDYLKII